MRRLPAILLCCALAAPAQAGGVMPWATAADTRSLAPDEKGLWQEADEFDHALERAGKIDSDPALTAYAQRIMDRLYPDFKARLTVRLLDAQQINAFALPNGSVYVNTGLVARFENEAQLATVLAHEGAHFVHRHSLQQAEQVRNAAAFAQVVAMLGVPLVGDLVALSSMFGYSREQEREADVVGYQRLVAAGYSPREAIHTFEHLQAELKAADIKEPFFFASHPKLQERIDSFTELARDSNGGETGRERFLAATSSMRLRSLEADLAAYRCRQLILVLADPAHRGDYPPEAGYYLGEAYRQCGGAGDLDAAEREFTRMLQTLPQFAPPYRALGLLCLKRGDAARAATLLRRYLELAPDAADRPYVEYYLNSLATPPAADPQPASP